MRSSRIHRLVSVVAVVGLIVALTPVVPVLEPTSVVRTRVHRVEHATLADFVTGTIDGAVTLREDDGGPTLGPVVNGAGDERREASGEPGGRYTSPVVELGLAATSVGLHWTQDSADEDAVVAEVRTSADGEAWSGWHALEPEGGESVPAGRRLFSILAATMGERFAQYRLTFGATPVAVRTVTLIGLDSAGPPALVLRPRLALLVADAAAMKPLGIVSRAQWGADESLRFVASEGQASGKIWPEEVTQVERIVIHHTAGPNVCSSADPYCQRRSVVAINDIYHYHSVVNGWGDIGYNSLVGYDGRIYEGRHGPEPMTGAGPVAQAVVGGHALGYNPRTHGISLMGNFEREPVPDRQYDALARMVGWIVESQLVAGGRVDPHGFGDYVRSNQEVHRGLPTIIGHRDVNETECPGDFLYGRLVELRYRAQRLAEWPPVHVELRAQPAHPTADAVTYRALVSSHERVDVAGMTIKAAVPTNAEYVDSWAGWPGNGRGTFDGSVVTWHDPEAALAPGRDVREYAFVVRPTSGVARRDVHAVAWAEFTAPARGIAMSEKVSADQPIEIIADPATGARLHWTDQWPSSRNVAGYYGDDYRVHAAGAGAATFSWTVDLPEAGSYEVDAWWTAAPDRATNTPYRLVASDGDHVRRVNQRENGKRWVRLGTFTFDGGPARVTVGNDADGYVIADAIRFRKQP